MFALLELNKTNGTGVATTLFLVPPVLEVVVMVSRVVPHATTLGYFRYLYSGLVAAARCAECRCHPRKSAGSRGGGEKVPRRDQEYSSACFSAGRGAESSALVTPTSTFTNINNQQSVSGVRSGCRECSPITSQDKLFTLGSIRNCEV